MQKSLAVNREKIRNPMHNAQSHNAILFWGGSLHKNNVSYLLLGLYHAAVNKISIVLMQITPQDEGYYGICASSECLKLRS